MQQALNSLRRFAFGDETPPATPTRDMEATHSTPEPGKARDTSADATEGGAQDYYHPHPKDIVYLRTMLAKATRLPADLVDAIFDFAEYWASSTNEVDFVKEHGTALRINGTGREEDRFLIRSFPVGLVGVDGRSNLAETLAYDLNEAKPVPLGREHEAAYFAKLADYPTPRLVNPVRKIVFSVKSKDQGWGGNREHKGTYKSSWTWFEAGLERFDADQTCEAQCPIDLRYQSPNSVATSLPLCAIRPVRPVLEALPPVPSSEDADEPAPGPRYKYVHDLQHDPKWEIQRNRSATKEFREHVVSWRWDDDIEPGSEEAQHLDDIGRGPETGTGELVRSLKMGDVIPVWGKARFGGWTNIIERFKIDIYWAV